MSLSLKAIAMLSGCLAVVACGKSAPEGLRITTEPPTVSASELDSEVQVLRLRGVVSGVKGRIEGNRWEVDCTLSIEVIDASGTRVDVVSEEDAFDFSGSRPIRSSRDQYRSVPFDLELPWATATSSAGCSVTFTATDHLASRTCKTKADIASP